MKTQSLPSTRNTTTIGAEVTRAALEAGIVTRGQSYTFFEHGHWWVENRITGAQYDAVDTDKGFAFEQVTQGDE